MKMVQLTGDVVIAGVPHSSSDKPMALEDDAADALIAADLAEETEPDDLPTKKVDQLTSIATEQGVDLTGITRKADIVAAIRDHTPA